MRAGAFVAIAMVVLGAAAAPASAHSTAGLPSTDWRSRVIAVRVDGAVDPAMHARTVDLGQHLEFTTDPERDVVVLGYSSEPFLWFTHGRVLENMVSPAVWLNGRKNLGDKVPAGYSATAPPKWRTLATATSWRWHDHRTHASSHDSRSHPWTVPIVVDQRDGAISGQLQLVPGPPLALLLGAVVLLTVVVVLLVRRAPDVLAIVAVVIAAAGAAQLVGEWRATSATVWQRLGPSSYAIGAVLAALLVASGARDAERREQFLLFGGVVLAVTGGLAHVDWLTHSQLPTRLPAELARAILVGQLATGVGATIAGVVLLERRANANDNDRARAISEPATPPPG